MQTEIENTAKTDPIFKEYILIKKEALENVAPKDINSKKTFESKKKTIYIILFI
jgi:hypothetical protein